MVRRRRLIIWALALLSPWIAASRGSADSLVQSLTGNPETDLPASAGAIVINNPLNATLGELHVSQPAWMAQQGQVSGINLKDLHLDLDKSGMLAVGLSSFGIVGDADGNGVQGYASPTTKGGAPSGISETPNLGNESIFVRIDYYDTNGVRHGIIAGIPENRSLLGSGTDGFTVNLVKDINNKDDFQNFGAALPASFGNLLFNPSAKSPGFEFTLNYFSQIPGIDLSKGIWVEAGAGSNDDTVGEDFIPWTKINFPAAQIITPEPTTLAAWSLMAGGAAWLRRRRRPAA